jgi:hypothetical protein
MLPPKVQQCVPDFSGLMDDPFTTRKLCVAKSEDVYAGELSMK